MTLYYQCSLSQGTLNDVAYIEARGAKVGNHVEVKGYEGLWLVEQVSDKGIDGVALQSQQQNQRNYIRNTDV